VTIIYSLGLIHTRDKEHAFFEKCAHIFFKMCTYFFLNVHIFFEKCAIKKCLFFVSRVDEALRMNAVYVIVNCIISHKANFWNTTNIFYIPHHAVRQICL
jgi:hypothetical protein